MPRELDFFFYIGSTYTYLAVNRVEQIAAREGVLLRWRPFHARAIMIEQNNRPFIGKPVKLQYMWRDVERRANRYGIPFRIDPRLPGGPRGTRQPRRRHCIARRLVPGVHQGNISRVVSRKQRPRRCAARSIHLVAAREGLGFHNRAGQRSGNPSPIRCRDRRRKRTRHLWFADVHVGHRDFLGRRSI